MESRWLYALSDDGRLFRSKTSPMAFEPIGETHCPTKAPPQSMAIDAQGRAWVAHSDGSLFRVSTADATCSPTALDPRELGSTGLGMAFGDPGRGEKLFVGLGGAEAGANLGLASIDLASMMVSRIGDDHLGTKRMELGSTDDGRLFGFLQGSPAELARIDPSTGEIVERRALDGVATGEVWAFTSWGGDFWFYTADNGGYSTVTRLSSGDGSLQVIRRDIGFRVVGAGVARCPHAQPPR